MSNVLDRCIGQLSNEFFIISKGELITVCYINNVLVHFATGTTEVTSIPTKHVQDICSNSMTASLLGTHNSRSAQL